MNARLRARSLLFIIVVIVGVTVVVVIVSVQPRFELDLRTPRIITEAGKSEQDLDITSGGALIVRDGLGSTLTGRTTPQDVWYVYNPRNFDQVKVMYPQIVFRAVTPGDSINWSNYEVKLSIIPTEHVVSTSPEVDGTDGIYLFFHYQDQDNLYVAGLTKDGRIVIKRKGSSYYGLIAEQYIFEGVYHRNDNFITPFVGSTITLTGVIKNLDNGNVAITIKAQIIDSEGKIVLSRELSGEDRGDLVPQSNGVGVLGDPIRSGRAGIRLDSIEALIAEFRVGPSG
jgi:hypothetical protein